MGTHFERLEIASGLGKINAGFFSPARGYSDIFF
jgi:hypothetical protein